MNPRWMAGTLYIAFYLPDDIDDSNQHVAFFG